jgi:acetyl-CoA/propionyl-CoA carboxylase biotin carboxyl carrier protein
MRFFVTLNGRESALTPSTGARTDGVVGVLGGERELAVEVLRAPRGQRPALVKVDGRVFRVHAEATPNTAGTRGSGERRFRVNGQPLQVQIETDLERRARPAATEGRSKGARITAPMPGRIVKLSVRPGDRVAAGAPLLSVEAMKMENELSAPSAGQVVRVTVEVGATVEADQELVVIAPDA